MVEVSIPKQVGLLPIDINGIIYFIEPRLNNLINCIKSSLYILNLADGWDDDDAIACNNVIYNISVALLINHAQSVLENFRVVIRNPEINLCRDGSIDLEWRTKDLILLINITNKDYIDIHYYGEDFKTKTILKGFLDNLNPNSDLVFWMQKLK